MRVFIVDDQAIIRKMVIDSCKKFFRGTDFIVEYVECDNGKSLLDDSSVKDIIFLDIEMPFMNGMEAAKLLRERKDDSYIIFLTSYIEYSLKAFQVKAFRYLLKPYENSEFEEVINDVLSEIYNIKRVRITYKGDDSYVAVNRIKYIESLGDVSSVFHSNKFSISNKTLTYWEECLGFSKFIRISRLYIVNIEYILRISGNKLYVEGDICLDIPRRKKKFITNVLRDYRLVI